MKLTRLRNKYWHFNPLNYASYQSCTIFTVIFYCSYLCLTHLFHDLIARHHTGGLSDRQLLLVYVCHHFQCRLLRLCFFCDSF